MRLVSAVILFAVLFGLSAFADAGSPDAAEQQPGTKPCITCHDGSWDRIHWTYRSLEYPAGADCALCHDHERTSYMKLTPEIVPLLAKAGIDPHPARNMCFTCHGDNPGDGPAAVDTIAVCTVCHSEQEVLIDAHSYGFVYEPTATVKVPKTFPLGSAGELTCLTCHEFRCEADAGNTNPLHNYLRITGATSKQFCFNCHYNEGVDRYSPHHQVNDAGEVNRDTCTVCHVKQPNPEQDKGFENVDLKGTTNDVCTGCHYLRDDHPTGQSHIVVPSAETRRTMNRNMKELDVYFPLDGDGAVMCVTCHTAHQYGFIQGHAEEEFRMRTRISGGKKLCRVCHDK